MAEASGGRRIKLPNPAELDIEADFLRSFTGSAYVVSLLLLAA
jgi:hypothetical protein